MITDQSDADACWIREAEPLSADGVGHRMHQVFRSADCWTDVPTNVCHYSWTIISIINNQTMTGSLGHLDVEASSTSKLRLIVFTSERRHNYKNSVMQVHSVNVC